MSMFGRNMKTLEYVNPAPPVPKFTLTEQQEAICERITGSSFKVVARAGSAKTDTMKYAVPKICVVEPNSPILICSFSNAITDDIKKAFNSLGYRNIAVSTIHSDAMDTLRKLKVRYKLSKYKGTEVSEQIIDNFPSIPYKNKFSCITQSARAVSMHKLTSEDPLFETDVTDTILEYGFLPAGLEPELFFDYVNAVYVEDLKQAERGIMNFDDVIIYATHFATIKNYKKYQTIVVDEAQDSNLAQLLYFKSLKADRYVLTFDPFQRIYSFNGAVKSVDKIARDLYGIEDYLKLSYSFRCPHAISAHIREFYVKDFHSFPLNKEGNIVHAETLDFLNLVQDQEECFVLARANSTLLEYFLKCLKNNIPAVLEKTNLDTVVKNIYKDCSNKGISIDQRLSNRLAEIHKAPYSEFRRQIFLRAETDNHTSAELLFKFIDQPTYAAAANKVDQFFKDAERGENKISFCTMHRSKGRQRKNGFLLPYKIKSEDEEETINIPYVGWSRFTDTIYSLTDSEES